MKRKRSLFKVYRRPGSEFFYAAFWDEHLKRYTSWKSTKAYDEKAAIVAAQRMLDEGRVKPLEEDPKLIDYAVSYWQTTKKEISTKYRADCIKFIKDYAGKFPEMKGIRMSRLKKHHLYRLRDYLEKTLSSPPRMIQRVIQSLTVPINHAFALGHIQEDVGHRVDKPRFVGKAKGILTIEELMKIIEWDAEKKRTKTIVLLGALAGLRLGEMKGLRWGSVDLEKRILLVKDNVVEGEMKHPKDDSFGKVIIADQLAEALEKLKTESPYTDEDDFVVYNEAGRHKPADSITFKRALNTTLHAINIKKEQIAERRLCIHGLRHFFASFSQAAGLGTFIGAKLTRHKSQKVFEHYSDHNEMIQLDTARAAIEEKLRRAASGK